MTEKFEEMDFSRYYQYEELTNSLKDIANRCNRLARLKSIGKTPRDRDIWLMEVTNFETGPPKSKPGIWIDGNTHGAEVTGSILCLKIIWCLVNKYEAGAFIKDLLDTKCFYILPRLNPDGAEIFLTTHFDEGDVWGGIPNPGWIDADGLYSEDINSDGWITDMRLKDPSGDWKVSEQDSRLMIKRKIGETGGEYFRIYLEGLIRNYDGGEITIAPPRWIGGSNRNYPANWAPSGKKYGASSGPFPLWEPEARAIADFLYEYKNVAVALTNHTAGGILLREFTTNEDAWFIKNGLKKDLDTYKAIGLLGEELTGYPCISTYEEFTGDKSTPRRGTAMDWLYEHWGILAFVTEMWDIAQEAGMGGFRERGGSDFRRDALSEENGLKALEWNDRELNGEGFMNWLPFNHPQLGSLEIGGWKKKFTWRNPPPHLLEKEIDKFVSFILKLADLLPLIKITQTKVIPMTKKIFKLSITIENKGYLPTYVTEQAKKISIAKPVFVAMDLDEEIELLMGKKKVEIGHLEGLSYKLQSMGQEGKTKETVQWIVDISACAKIVSEPSVRVCVISEKGGTCIKKIVIPVEKNLRA